MKIFAQLSAGIFALMLTSCVSAPPSSGVSTGTAFEFQRSEISNGCFIDAVRLLDRYYGKKGDSEDRWGRVFQWGFREPDFRRGGGHAVAVFLWRGGLLFFDINHGVRQLNVPAEARHDIQKIAVPIFAMYPHVEAVGPEFLMDVWQPRTKGVVGAPIDLRSGNSHYLSASRAAYGLGESRRVRLIRYTRLESGDVRVESAALAFLYEGRLCVYMPEKGTAVQPRVGVSSLENFREIRRVLLNEFGPQVDVRFSSESVR